MLMVISSVGGESETPRLVGENVEHTVQPGESLFKIAQRYDVSFTALARANAVANPNVIRVGRVLTVPLRTIIPRVLTDGVLINIPEYRLYLFKNGVLVRVVPVCVGLPTWKTPRGEFRIINKVKNPAWFAPPEMRNREKITKEMIPAGPTNPLGDYWVGTSLEHTGIHSTNNPMSIGRSLSHGCVRLYPGDILTVFDALKVGDGGEYVYEPLKIAVLEEDILLEAHPDVYGLVPDMHRRALEMLAERNLTERVDPDRLMKVVSEQRGVPVLISAVKADGNQQQ